MALKDTVSKWHGSICLLEVGRHEEAIQELVKIVNPSSKIIYNLGCVNMLCKKYNDAVQYFDESIEKDQYLAIAYFLKGVCLCWLNKIDDAYKTFIETKSAMTRDEIDYHQLGAAVSIDISMIDRWLQALENARRGRASFPDLKPILDFVLRPSKKMVASLGNKDFLGKAKVISSVQEDDIIYATERKATTSGPPPKRPEGPLLPPRKTKAMPPPPQRRPPELTNSVKERGRRKWKSMESLVDSQDADDANNGNAGGISADDSHRSKDFHLAVVHGSLSTSSPRMKEAGENSRNDVPARPPERRKPTPNNNNNNSSSSSSLSQQQKPPFQFNKNDIKNRPAQPLPGAVANQGAMAGLTIPILGSSEGRRRRLSPGPSLNPPTALDSADCLRRNPSPKLPPPRPPPPRLSQ